MNKNDIIKQLDKIDWDFKDYSIASSPNDINYLHWHPAPFIPQIPSIIIQLFSDKTDKILDPFCGSGVTLIEAAKQKRKFIGVDNNPFSIDITEAKFLAILNANDDWVYEIKNEIESKKNIKNIDNYCEKNNINLEVKKWFEQDTLYELLQIYDILKDREKNKTYLLEKIIFSSTLYKVCSQRDHYTYITDRCFPKKLIKYPVKYIYLEKVDIINKASKLFRNQFKAMYNHEIDKIEGEIRLANAQSLTWIRDDDIKLIVTSPPYLGVHDYIKSMRLLNNFFYNYNLTNLVQNEMGSRSKRKRKNAFENYINELILCFNEFKRTLQDDGFLAIVIGQGKGKVVKSNIVEIVNNYLINELNFTLFYKKSRQVMYRRIQTPGSSNEYIEIFKKTN